MYGRMPQLHLHNNHNMSKWALFSWLLVPEHALPHGSMLQFAVGFVITPRHKKKECLKRKEFLKEKNA